MAYIPASIPMFLTSVIAAALAALVFRHGPGRAAHRALATYLLAVAGVHFAWGVSTLLPDAEGGRWNSAGYRFLVVAGLAAIPLALAWPTRRPWAPRAATRVYPYAAVGLAFVAFLVANAAFDLVPRSPSLLSAHGAVNALQFVAIDVPAFVAAALLVEARRTEDLALRDGRILLAVALAIPHLYQIVRDLAAYPSLGDSWSAVGLFSRLYLAPWLAAFLWLVARVPAGGSLGLARWILAACAGSALLDTALHYAVNVWGMTWAPQYGGRMFIFASWKLVAIGLFAVVVLRGQIPGLEVKARWSVSRSTIVAVFVAAFFVVSEGAQQFFGEVANSEYVGIVAAGALVFALAPLQRVADRFAARAVPKPVELPGDVPHAAAYRAAVRAALRDDVITPREEEHLAEVAQELGIGARDALRLRREVEAEAPAERAA